ncbi:hypothetical protein BDY17DRAFT_295018 [Neohortaea acidophila]|uniref:MARVEL domain-containing protein n=1 Tax=Neohortaea acidophila TaxID=245834 RepID=A0A6A6PY25_9PEZI|nr:uncharacterized protein BDY17DRAFT_295018 [Neohortaea acidophila]KAF2484127.1 hypothetical protein BDY17DRAFT_295018 [Neohortaea acidophila]
MVLSGFLFLSVRVWEIIITVPIVGMLGWLVHVFVHANLLTPTYILLLFIVATLALAWEIFTVISYLRARHDALFIAFTDLCFLGAFIAGVVVLRFVTKYNCSSVGPVWTPQHGGVSYSSDPSKVCAVLKASFAFGIIDILNFAVTFFLALLVYHHHRNDDRVVVKREYSRSSRHNSRHSSGNHRSSRDYDRRPRSNSGRHSSRRREWV